VSAGWRGACTIAVEGRVRQQKSCAQLVEGSLHPVETFVRRVEGYGVGWRYLCLGWRRVYRRRVQMYSMCYGWRGLCLGAGSCTMGGACALGVGWCASAAGVYV
jgi:hypothetical protein